MREERDLAWPSVEFCFFSCKFHIFHSGNQKRLFNGQMTTHVGHHELHMRVKFRYCHSHWQGAAAVNMISRNLDSPFSQGCHSKTMIDREKRRAHLRWIITWSFSEKISALSSRHCDDSYFKKSKREKSKNAGLSSISPPLGGAAGWPEIRYCPEHRPICSPSLIEIGRKMAEKSTDRHTHTNIGTNQEQCKPSRCRNKPDFRPLVMQLFTRRRM